MTQCASVRKKGSVDQCESSALRGHTLCGRHARCKHPVLWSSLHVTKGKPIEKVQALVRGWIVRRHLKVHGVGVLKRKNLANDEDLFTCESKERQYPFDYFSFEENGKIWWFDFNSLWNWISRSHDPVNPYTKTPLSTETRKRIRTVWGYRVRFRYPLPEESKVFDERIRHRWNVLSQIFADYGFIDVHPMNFAGLERADYLSMFILLRADIESVYPKSDPFREKAIRLCTRGELTASTVRPTQYILQSALTLLLLLNVHREPYTMVFLVLSALYRC